MTLLARSCAQILLHKYLDAFNHCHEFLCIFCACLILVVCTILLDVQLSRNFLRNYWFLISLHHFQVRFLTKIYHPNIDKVRLIESLEKNYGYAH